MIDDVAKGNIVNVMDGDVARTILYGRLGRK